MGMSTHVSGIRDLDGQFAKMLAAKEACELAGVSYPAEVKAYFKYPEEDAEFQRLEMQTVDIKDAVTEGSRDMTDFWIVDLSKLPKECKAIRVENSY